MSNRAPNSTLEQAIATICVFKHWTLKTMNQMGTRRGFECTIWGEGRRVSAQAATPIDAINRALKKLRDKTTGTGLRIVR